MKEIIWKVIAPEFQPVEFGAGFEKLKSEILILIYGLRLDLPGGCKIIINCGYEDRPGGHGKGLALDFRITDIAYKAALNRIESYLKRKGLANYVAFGIYPEWGVELPGIVGLRPGFHLEVETEVKPQPRRWAAQYKKNEDGTLFLRDRKPVQEYISYEAGLKLLGNNFTV